MANKNLTFDAKRVTTEATTIDYLTVTIDTEYPNEILDEFTPEEIVANYTNLNDLYIELKEQFED